VLRINADGAAFDLSSGDGTARLVRVNMPPPERYIFGLDRVLSRDGVFAVVEHGRRGNSVNQPIRDRLYVWNFAEGRVVATYPGSVSGSSVGVAPVAISPDGRRVVLNGFDRFLLWDIPSGRIREIARNRGIGYLHPDYSPRDGEQSTWIADTVVGVREDGSMIDVWQLDPARPEPSIINYRLAMRSDDGGWVAAGGTTQFIEWHRSIALWESASGHALGVIDAHESRVVSVDPAARRMVTAFRARSLISDDVSVHLWNLDDLTTINRFTASMFGNASVDEDLTTIFTVSRYEDMAWDLRTGGGLPPMRGNDAAEEAIVYPGEASTVRLHRRGRMESVELLPRGRTGPGRHLLTHREPVYVDFFGPYLLLRLGTFGTDRQLRDAGSGRLVATGWASPTVYPPAIAAFGRAPDTGAFNGRFLATDRIRRIVGWYDFTTGRLFQPFAGAAFAIALTRDRTRVLTQDADGRFAIRDVRTGRTLVRLAGYIGHESDFGGQGRFLEERCRVMGWSRANTIIFWDANTGEELVRVVAADGSDPDAPHSLVAILPSGHYAATPGGEARLHVTEGVTSYPIDAYRERFNRPDEVMAVLRGTSCRDGQGAQPAR
jgi:WD40 repeat protein